MKGIIISLSMVTLVSNNVCVCVCTRYKSLSEEKMESVVQGETELSEILFEKKVNLGNKK